MIIYCLYCLRKIRRHKWEIGELFTPEQVSGELAEQEDEQRLK